MAEFLVAVATAYVPVPSSDYAKKRKSMDAPSASVSKGKGKGERLRSTGSCFQFQSGKSSRGAECRFKHTCKQCGKESHGRSQCPEVTEG